MLGTSALIANNTLMGTLTYKKLVQHAIRPGVLDQDGNFPLLHLALRLVVIAIWLPVVLCGLTTLVTTDVNAVGSVS